MAQLTTRGWDPNGSWEIKFGSRDSNFPGINLLVITQHEIVTKTMTEFSDIQGWARHVKAQD